MLHRFLRADSERLLPTRFTTPSGTWSKTTSYLDQPGFTEGKRLDTERQKRLTFRRVVAAAWVLALCGSVQARAAEPPTAKELYRQALIVMNDLKEPAFITYRLDGTSEGLRIDLKTDPCDRLEFHFGNNRDRWTLRHRVEDLRTGIVDTADGRRGVVATFGPTWLSTYKLLRAAPLHFGPLPCRPLPIRSEPTPAPTPDASPGPALKVIGTVVALGPGIYNVEDRGDAPCPNGDPGHAFHLWSRTNNPSQTLSDVVIELKSMRFCTIRFGVRSGGGTAVYEQHFADVGGYWVQTDGLIDVTGRVAGIAAGHGIWRYRISEMQFPDSLTPDVFAPSPPAAEKR